MKTTNTILTLTFLLSYLFISCEKENTSQNNFRIEFHNGYKITEDDIAFYDSSTHILFLKNDLKTKSDFNVFVNSDTIYSGVMHNCMLSTPPIEKYYINSCVLYGSKVLELYYHEVSGYIDRRNDPIIINALDENKLLCSGLTCKIDSIYIDNTVNNNSEVVCTITITNPDMVPYYFLHPDSMGEMEFNYYTGGLSFTNISTNAISILQKSSYNPYADNLTMKDLSLIPKNSQISITFNSSDYNKIEAGDYIVSFQFRNIEYSYDQFEIKQENGWIWIGSSTSKYNLKVE